MAPSRLSLATPLLLAGCFPLPKVCLTPVYDAPSGFSETYHAAVMRQEPLLTAGTTTVPGGDVVVGPPIFLWPGTSTTAEPPMEW